jgi:AcrR family transcriptional regulator
MLQGSIMTRAANIDLPNRILEEAEKVVVASGYQGINMRDLAGRVGVSATAIYHYFSSKGELIRTLRLRAVELLNQRIRAISRELPVPQFLSVLGREYLDFAEKNPNLYRLVFEAPLDEQSSTDHPVYYYTYRAARDALQRMAEAGGQQADPRYGAMMGWTMLHGFSSLMMSGVLPPAEGMSKDTLREVFMSFYSGGGEGASETKG